MERLLRTLGLFFILVTLPRVAIFANRFVPENPWDWWVNPFGALGLLFAIGLGVGVYVTAYYAASAPTVDNDDIKPEEMTRHQRTRYEKKKQVLDARYAVAKRALLVGIAFAILDSLFNLAEVGYAAQQRGMIEGLFRGELILVLAVWAFGLFPTFASAISAWMVSSLDKVPSQYRGSKAEALPIIGKVIRKDKPVATPEPSEEEQPNTEPTLSSKQIKANFINDYNSGKLGKYLEDNGLEFTAGEIETLYGVSERTAYRYLKLVQEYEE